MPMILSVASGKGGTGKTSVAVNLALSICNAQLLDCDVEEPNAHIYLHPERVDEKPVCSLIPCVDKEACNLCGRCAEVCQYHAIFAGREKVLVFPELCHSCGGCSIVCPEKAITEEEHKVGTLKSGLASGVELVYGELELGEPMAVPVIREVKKRISNARDVIIDSPPGTSCTVVESTKGSDFCLLVTEPTPFGLHDLEIMVQVLSGMKIPLGVVVNRMGIGDSRVHDFCRRRESRSCLRSPTRGGSLSCIRMGPLQYRDAGVEVAVPSAL